MTSVTYSVKELVDKLEVKIETGFERIERKIEDSHRQIESRLENHEARIWSIEQERANERSFLRGASAPVKLALGFLAFAIPVCISLFAVIH